MGIVPGELLAVGRLKAKILAGIQAWCSLYNIHGFLSGPGCSFRKARRIGLRERQNGERLGVVIRSRDIVMDGLSRGEVYELILLNSM